jgi:hypothetical protein
MLAEIKHRNSQNSTFYLAAVSQVTHNPKAREYYLKKQSEGKTKKHALRCVMKRLAMIVYGMLRGTHLRRDTVIPQWFQASKAAARQ